MRDAEEGEREIERRRERTRRGERRRVKRGERENEWPCERRGMGGRETERERGGERERERERRGETERERERSRVRAPLNSFAFISLFSRRQR